MPYYVRVVDGSWLSKNELTSSAEYEWVQSKGDNAIPSDFVLAVGNIKKCQMSVFITNDLSNLELIIASIKAKVSENKDLLHAIVVDERDILRLNLSIEPTQGDTPEVSINSTHRNIKNLTLNELNALLELFFNTDKQSFTSAEIHALIKKKLRDGEWNSNVHPDYKKNL